MSAPFSCQDPFPFGTLDHNHLPGVLGKWKQIVKRLYSNVKKALVRSVTDFDISFLLQEFPYTRHVTEAGLAKETDLYFMGVVERGTGKSCRWQHNWILLMFFFLFALNVILYANSSVSLSARLNAAVVLSPRYPEISPVFSLSLSWKGERSGRTDDNLRVWTFQNLSIWLFINTSHFSLFDSPFSLLRPWRAKLTCSKTNYKDHVLGTSSWPISLHDCASAWMFIWRQKDKTTAWKDRESSPVRRCAYALSGTVRERSGKIFDTFGERFYLWPPVCLFQCRGPNRLKPFKYNHPQGFFSHR